MGLFERVGETVAVIRRKAQEPPMIGIILGTGLGGFGEKIEGARTFPYERLPHFPQSTVESHKGQLIFGKVSKQPVVVMEGRFHCYEGYSPEEVTYPVRVMQALGTRLLIVTNASGGMNPYYSAGDLMVVTDHINLMGINPLIGPNDERLGLRFPDMSSPYDPKLVALAQHVADECNISLHQGVYVAVSGPNLETRAEYRFLRNIGADAVGMSTIPEVLVAIHAGMRVLAVSCITDRCIPETLKPASVEEIIRIANEAGPKLAQLLTRVIEQI